MIEARLASAASNMLMDHLHQPPADPAAEREESRDRGLRLADSVRPVPPRPRERPSAEGPLRIGYVAADPCRHPVGWLAGSAPATHDPAAVHVTAHAAGTVEDDLTDRLRRAIGGWLPVAELDDAALAAELVGDPARLAKLRRRQRRLLRRSPLLDGAALARALEAAYRRLATDT